MDIESLFRKLGIVKLAAIVTESESTVVVCFRFC